MFPLSPYPRLYFLRAQEAPIIVVFRHGPSKRYHIIKINTQTHTLERGSWFTGSLRSEECDLSFDGEWLIYAASSGYAPEDWTGLCRTPWLKTYREWHTRWNGGGFFASRTLLHTTESTPMSVSQDKPVPFTFSKDSIDSEDAIFRYGNYTARFVREGWQRLEPPQISNTATTGSAVPYIGRGKWICQPSPDHPRLTMRGRVNRYGYHSLFALDHPADLLDNRVEWANWDALGHLIVARQGLIQKYTLADLATGQPSMIWDLRAMSRNDEKLDTVAAEIKEVAE